MFKRMLFSLLLVSGAMQSAEMTERGGKCKSFQNLTVCNLKVGSLAVSGNLAIAGNEAITGNVTVGGNEAITGNVTVGGNETITGNVAVGGNETIANNLTVGGTIGGQAATFGGQVTLSNLAPQIALANGGHLLDYASFASQTELLIATGAPATFDPAFSLSSPSITLGVDNQTITFANAGTYLLSGYMMGSATVAQTGFSFVFANPVVTAITISGGVQTIGVITTISGSAIVNIAAGQTVQLTNPTAGDFNLSDADVPGGARTVGVTIIRLQ